jgi:serine/threonine-protein kinase HipA
MEAVQKIFVSIQFNDVSINVGELVRESKNIYFKYNSKFLKNGFNISPIKLAFTDAIQNTNDQTFDGLHGVFADALPDGWGKLLLDRALQAKGINLNTISVLDRLAFVGEAGMGALIFKPEKPMPHLLDFNIELDAIANHTKKIIRGASNIFLDELFILGGSSGGARPKVLLAYNIKTKHLIAQQNNLPKNYDPWIVKFSATVDKPDIANIEYAYYKMAMAAGIIMSDSMLMYGKSGQAYFATKRFDRIGNTRLHMHSAAGIMHDNFRLSNMDYGNIMDCAFNLEKNVQVYEKILRLATFNIFSHNRDDHSKNISFLMDSKGKWQVAPAYDLTFSNSSHGYHSTMVAGESANPGPKHLLELANYFRIKNASSIITEVRKAVNNWQKFADMAGVSVSSKKMIGKIIVEK